MATELKGTTNFTLTQFSGGDRGRCLQVTSNLQPRGGDKEIWQRDYVQLTKEDAIELAIALIEWSHDKRDDTFSVDTPSDLI